jgi:hypothetical protein
VSTNSECEILRLRDTGEWFYVLEHMDAPKNSWDWREYATAYGPFVSEEQAEDHLDRYHANPGGWCVDEDAVPDEVLRRLIDDARKRPVGRGTW